MAELTLEELAEAHLEVLPARETLGCWNPCYNPCYNPFWNPCNTPCYVWRPPCYNW